MMKSTRAERRDEPRYAEDAESRESGASGYRGWLGAVACLLVATGAVAAEDAIPTVSQRGREFNPGTLSIKRGQTVLIVNDDLDLLHHAYVDAKTFLFDSGDQPPGSKTKIVFSVPGDFKVLCGIHPKMKLLVHVE